MSSNILLEIIDLTLAIKQNGRWKTIVHSLNFTLHKGESLGLVGESGCGKSLTAQAIMRLLPQPNIKIIRGQILFNDIDIVTLDQQALSELRGKDIAMIFQEPMTALNPVISIGQQIFEQIRLHFPRLARASIKQQVIELLNDVGIELPCKRYHSYPHQLSGGMRQRVMIAMALSCKPQLIIADEPTTALDVTLQQQILVLLKNLRTKYHTSLLFISHDLAVVAQVCERALIMYRGEIIEQGAIDILFENPTHPYSKALLLCTPTRNFLPRSLLPTIDSPKVAFKTRLERFQYFERILEAFERSRADSTSMPVASSQINSDNKRIILSVKNIDKYFVLKKSFFKARMQTLRAVNNISFSLNEGETLGIVGTSGSGKSTLARIIAGIEYPDSGHIEYCQNVIEFNKSHLLATDIQYVFQDPQESLNSRQTIKEILIEPLIIHKIGSATEQYQRLKEILLLVGLEENMLERYPHEFSGGQKQRVGIARALMLKPKLLICDEPVSALDVSVQAQILNLLNDLQKRLNLSLIFITHDLSVVRHMADNIAVMNNGKIVEYGEALSICDQPQEKYTQQLIASTPTWPIVNNALACGN